MGTQIPTALLWDLRAPQQLPCSNPDPSSPPVGPSIPPPPSPCPPSAPPPLTLRWELVTVTVACSPREMLGRDGDV